MGISLGFQGAGAGSSSASLNTGACSGSRSVDTNLSHSCRTGCWGVLLSLESGVASRALVAVDVDEEEDIEGTSAEDEEEDEEEVVESGVEG